MKIGRVIYSDDDTDTVELSEDDMAVLSAGVELRLLGILSRISVRLDEHKKSLNELSNRAPDLNRWCGDYDALKDRLVRGEMGSTASAHKPCPRGHSFESGLISAKRNLGGVWIECSVDGWKSAPTMVDYDAWRLWDSRP